MPPQAGSDLAAVGKLPSLLNRAMGAAAKASSSLSSSPGSSVSANAVRAAATAAAAVGAGAAAPPAVPRVVFSAAVAPGHRMEGHVEQPARVETILRRLREAGITGGACAGQVVELPAERRLPLEAARAVHSYVDQLAAAQARAVAEGRPQPVADIGDPDGVTYVCPSSLDDALRAAGAACALVDAVVAASPPRGANAKQAQGQGRGQGQGGAGSSGGGGGTAAFCLTRPPGHHATADTPLGYCLLNNVALAARHAQAAHGLQRVLILDFDLHHGNGTAAIFAEDPEVLFVDTHEASSIYPPPYAGGAATDVGEGAGRGATINVPLPRYAGETSVLAVFDGVVAPAARRFCPDIILVSAGFDAHWRDPFQQLQFRSSTYHALAARLSGLAAQLCGGRLAFLLEGGYETEAVGESVAEVFLALLGRPSVEGAVPLALPRPEPRAEVAALVEQLRRIHGLE